MKYRLLKKLPNCKSSQALIYFKQDFSLSWYKKLNLKSHLLMCKSCSNIEKNATTLRALLKKWR